MSFLKDCCLHVCGSLHRGTQAPAARPFAIVGDRRRAYQRRPIIGRLLSHSQPSGHVRGNLVNPLTSLADRRRVTPVHTVVFQSKSGRRRTERHTLDHFTSMPWVVHQHIADRNFYLATLLSVRGQMPLRARQSSFRFPCALQIRTSFPLHQVFGLALTFR